MTEEVFYFEIDGEVYVRVRKFVPAAIVKSDPSERLVDFANIWRPRDQGTKRFWMGMADILVMYYHQKGLNAFKYRIDNHRIELPEKYEGKVRDDIDLPLPPGVAPINTQSNLSLELGEEQNEIEAVDAKIEEDNSILDGPCDLCGEDSGMADVGTGDLNDVVRLCTAHLYEHIDELDVVIAEVRAGRNGGTLALPKTRTPFKGEWDRKAQNYEQDEPDFFDPNDDEDARERRDRSMVYRRGQPQFRSDLMKAYGKRCAITDCDVAEVLEACHIRPYNGDKTNHVTNGILLRADLHTLFDKKLFAIDLEKEMVLLAPELKGTAYDFLDGADVLLPDKEACWPNMEALEKHMKEAEKTWR